MNLKIEDFNQKTKSTNKKTLICVDVFENINDKTKYDFFYKISMSNSKSDDEFSTATLFQFIEN